MMALILSAAEGGIRKHVFDLIAESNFVKENCNLVIYPENQTDGLFDAAARVHHWHGIRVEKSLGLRDIAALLSIIKLLRANSITLVHAHGAKAGLYARLAKLVLWKLQVVYSPHGGSFHSANQGSLKFLILGLERFLARLTSAFVFESNFAKSIFSRAVDTEEKKINIIANCVEEKSDEVSISLRDEFQRKRDQGFKIITVVGRIREIKGHDIVAKALAQSGLSWIVYFVGNPDQDYVAKNTALFNHPSIVMWGDDVDVNSFYRLSDVIVCPSRAESFGYVPVEAYLCNAKIVASDIPAFRENLGGAPAVFFYDAENAADLAQKISDCLASSDTPSADSVKNKFSPKIFGNKFDQLYRRLVN